MRKIMLLCVILMECALPTAHAQNADGVLGQWVTEKGKSYVEIYKCADKYCGKISWLKEINDPEDGQPKHDKNNPDVSKRERPIIGLTMMWDFVYDGKEWWDNGQIYDPENGKTYRCKMKLDGGVLMVRGYAGPFYRTTQWKKV